jgi:hypothetical protein
MHQNSPLARLLGSASQLPLVGKLFGAGEALKGVLGFVLALAALPFVGFGPVFLWLLFKTAERASYAAAAGSAEAEKQRLPIGLIITTAIALGLSIYSVWPASAAAPVAPAAGHGLSWMKGNVAGVQAGPGAFLSTGPVEGMPGFVMYAQLIAGKLFGASLSGGAMVVAMVFVLGIGGFVLYLLAKPYLAGNPAEFARDAQSLYQLTRANRLGSISRRALVVVDRVLADFKGNTRGERMAKLVDAMYAEHPDVLLRGDIEASAKRDYPPKKYKMLFTRMKLDLVRSLVVRGHTITNESLSVRARLYVSREHVARAYESSIRAAMPSEGAVSVAGYFLAAAVFFGVANLLASLLGGGWVMALLSLPVAGASAFATWKWHQLSSVQRIASGALRPCNIAPVINRIINSAEAALELERTRDAVGPYQHDYDLIEDMRDQWNKQLEIAASDEFKLIEFGTSRGTAQFRGDVSAYRQGQVVAASANDIGRGGASIVGPTGGGKSFGSLNPLIGQFMDAVMDTFMNVKVMFSKDDVADDEFEAA